MGELVAQPIGHSLLLPRSCGESCIERAVTPIGIGVFFRNGAACDGNEPFGFRVVRDTAPVTIQEAPNFLDGDLTSYR